MNWKFYVEYTQGEKSQNLLERVKLKLLFFNHFSNIYLARAKKFKIFKKIEKHQKPFKYFEKNFKISKKL